MTSGGHLTDYRGGGRNFNYQETLKQTIGLNAMIQ